MVNANSTRFIILTRINFLQSCKELGADLGAEILGKRTIDLLLVKRASFDVYLLLVISTV